MTQKFMIPMKLPSLNEVNRVNRTHWSQGAKLKTEIESIIGWAIVNAQLKPVKKYPCKIGVVYYEPNKRRDIDNVYSSNKFILDALQRQGILKNDNPNCVSQIVNTVIYGKVDHYVEVEIVEC